MIWALTIQLCAGYTATSCTFVLMPRQYLTENACINAGNEIPNSPVYAKGSFTCTPLKLDLN